MYEGKKHIHKMNKRKWEKDRETFRELMKEERKQKGKTSTFPKQRREKERKNNIQKMKEMENKERKKYSRNESG